LLFVSFNYGLYLIIRYISYTYALFFFDLFNAVL
jgi:hypothetical protein